MSANGQLVAFSSYATNLVSGDTNGVGDIFITDRTTGTISRVSVASNGSQANGASFDPAFSGDGRYLAFESTATNLVSNDTNNSTDIFVHDRVMGTTTRISVASNGNQADGASFDPAFSADGRYVAYESAATNLVSGDTNAATDVFLYDRVTGITTRVSVAPSSMQANGGSFDPTLSNDGRFVAFHSDATNLVSGDTNAATDIFVFDRTTGTTTRVSIASNGNQADGMSNDPVLSTDGRFVTFWSVATTVVSGDTNGTDDVFLHDRTTGITTRISVASNGSQANGRSFDPVISADGAFISFDLAATNLVSGDTNGAPDIFIHDRVTGVTTRVSIATNGSQATGASSNHTLNADGRYVAFESNATNLVSGDTNGTSDIFVRDRGVPTR